MADRISFSSNSDIGEGGDLVGECSPIKDDGVEHIEEVPVRTSTLKRVKQLEKLLSKNLENQASIQSNADREIGDLTKRMGKLLATVSSFEKQQKRDQMIIKFRDATIQRFNTKEALPDAEAQKEFQNLRKEIEALKSHEDPKSALLFSEKEALQSECEKLKIELGDSLDSLSHQYRSSLEFMDELRAYIKEYIEREEQGQEKILKERLESEKLEIVTKFEARICDMQVEIDEASACNLQLREESEQQQDRIGQLKEEMRVMKESHEEQLEMKESNFAETLNELKTELAEGKESAVKAIQIELLESKASIESLEKELEKEKTSKEEMGLKFSEL